jgi:hypothetical protein
MGHIRMVGYVTEEEHFGAKLGRIDVSMEDGSKVTQYFSGSAIFRVTPTTEEIARRAARTNSVQPISAWELRERRGEARGRLAADWFYQWRRDHGWQGLGPLRKERANEQGT